MTAEKRERALWLALLYALHLREQSTPPAVIFQRVVRRYPAARPQMEKYLQRNAAISGGQ